MGFSEIHFIFPFCRFLIFSLIVNCFLARLNCQLKLKVMNFLCNIIIQGQRDSGGNAMKRNSGKLIWLFSSQPLNDNLSTCYVSVK
jgi:hypothetical protein